MTEALTGIEAAVAQLGASLPSGYRARPFEERDREPMVASRNRELHPIQAGDAEEWRMWERLAPPKGLLRVVVEDANGAPVAMGDISQGFVARPDGSLSCGIGVDVEQRRRGIGGALLAAIEDEGRRRGAPALLSGTDEQIPEGLEWATKRGYKEIGRRIQSYVDLTRSDPEAHANATRRVRDGGVALVSFAERLAGADEAGREAFWHVLWEAEGPMWEDIPRSRPAPHIPYEEFRRMAVGSGRLLEDCSVLALDGERIAGFTMTGRRRKDDGHTYMTGVGREHRGRGIGFALKVEALRRAKERGLRALLTTNDEPNKAMRGINARLGYQMLPARIELEKKL